MPIALPPLNGEAAPYFNEEGQILSYGPANNIGEICLKLNDLCKM